MKFFKKIFLAFLVWRAFLFGIQFFSVKIPFRYSFPYVEAVLGKYHPAFLRPWANFDGVHYLTIAKSGYLAQYTQAFFPLYPLLIRWVGNIFFLKNYLLAGHVISSIFWLLSLLMLVKLAELDFDRETSFKALLFLILFPTSFYFVSLYAESMFLFLILFSFYCARKRNWWGAGILAGFASATKLFGIFLLPALLVEGFLQKGGKKTKKRLSDYLPVGLSCLGLLLYMLYLKSEFGNPFYFATAQPAFGASRSVKKVILLYQVFWRYFKMILTVTKTDPLYFTVWLEFLSGTVFLGLLFLAWRQKIRESYLVFAALSYILPTLTGTFSSMPRYVLVLFPCFISLALIENKRLVKSIYLLEVALMIICTLLFLRGYWVG